MVGNSHDGGGSPRSSKQVLDNGTFSGQDWVETIPQGDDTQENSHLSLEKWSFGLITWLLEIAHGQWL